MVFKVLLCIFLFDPPNISEGDMAGSLSLSLSLPPTPSLCQRACMAGSFNGFEVHLQAQVAIEGFK